MDQKLVLAVCDIRFSGIGFWLQGTSRWLKESAKPRSSISESKKDYVFLIFCCWQFLQFLKILWIFFWQCRFLLFTIFNKFWQFLWQYGMIVIAAAWKLLKACWLFSKLRTSIQIHDNHSDTGQHLQFLRCFKSVTVWKGMFSVDNVVRDPLTIFELLTPVQRGFATMGRIWLMTRRNLGRSASLLLFFPITFSNLALLLVCLIWALPTRARYHERGWVLSTLSD